MGILPLYECPAAGLEDVEMKIEDELTSKYPKQVVVLNIGSTLRSEQKWCPLAYRVSSRGLHDHARAEPTRWSRAGSYNRWSVFVDSRLLERGLESARGLVELWTRDHGLEPARIECA